MLNYYENSEYISNSMLGWLDRSPLYFQSCINGDYERKESLSLERGSLLHLYILEPEKFIVEDIEPVGGLMGQFIRKKVALELNNSVDSSQLAYNESGFKHTIETVIKNFEKDEKNQEYYQFLKLANGKLAITKQDKYIIEKCTESLFNNSLANNLLFGVNEDLEVYNEHEIYLDNFLIPGFKAKAKLDRVIINRKKDYAIIIDLKTTSKSCYGNLIEVNKTGNPKLDYLSTGFMSSYINYSYYRQQSYYAFMSMIHFGVSNVESFIVPVETNGMFESCVYKQSRKMAISGINESKALITKYLYHKEKGDWSKPQGFEEGFKLI